MGSNNPFIKCFVKSPNHITKRKTNYQHPAEFRKLCITKHIEQTFFAESINCANIPPALKPILRPRAVGNVIYRPVSNTKQTEQLY